MCKAYNRIIQQLKDRGIPVKKHIIDNEASDEFLKTIQQNGVEYENIPPNIHQCNAAKNAISTFKDHFIAILSGLDKIFPMNL